MGHDFVNRLVFLVFFCVFVRTRRDVKVMFVVFMLALYVAVPSALYNWMTGQLLRGFRAASSVTVGRQPEPPRHDLPDRDGAAAGTGRALRPGLMRQMVALGGHGRVRDGALRDGLAQRHSSASAFSGILLQTGPRGYRVPAAADRRACSRRASLAVAVMVPAGSLGADDPLQPGEGRGRRQLERRCARRRSSAPGRWPGTTRCSASVSATSARSRARSTRTTSTGRRTTPTSGPSSEGGHLRARRLRAALLGVVEGPAGDTPAGAPRSARSRSGRPRSGSSSCCSSSSRCSPTSG